MKTLFVKSSSKNSIHKTAGIAATVLGLSALMMQPAQAGVSKCFATSDAGSNGLFYMVPNSGLSPLPGVTTLVMDRGFNGEGSAYRPSNQTMYLFQCNGDTDGPCDLWSATPDFTTNSAANVLEQANIIPNVTPAQNGNPAVTEGAIEGAIFETTPAGVEFLYATTGEGQSRLWKWATDTWTLQPGYPINITGDATTITGLAFSPRTNTYYGSKDRSSFGPGGSSGNPDVYTIDLNTGTTSFAFELQSPVDAEGLSFGADGKLFVEEDNGASGLGRRILEVNTTTGAVTPAASYATTSGDVESLACNAGERSDFGDAPESYGYAVHSIPVFDATPSPVHLGALRPDNDDDPFTQAGAGADGDDNNATAPNPFGSNDEDGVTQGGVSLQNQQLQIGGSFTLQVETSGQNSGFLNAWMDFNLDGDFDDPNEQIAVNEPGLPNSTINIPVSVPGGIDAGQTYARFRYGSQMDLPAADDLFGGQEAIDGEVEDYRVIFAGNPLALTKESDDGGNADGNVRPGDTITYTISPDYTLSGALSNVTISDIIPDNTTYVADSDTPEAVSDTDPLVWQLGSTVLGESVSVASIPGATLTFTAVKDTYIDEDKDDENFGDGNDIEVSIDPGKDQRGLVEWNLSSIPASANVLDASLSFFANDDKDIIVDIRQLTTFWAQGDGTNQEDATWLESVTNSAWTAPGGDFDPALIGSFVQDTKNVRDVVTNTDVIDLVQGWIDGSENNFGVILTSRGSAGDPTDNDSAKIRTQDQAVNLAPELTVTLQGTAATSASLDAPIPLVQDGTAINLTLTLTSDMTGPVSPGALTVVNQQGGANAVSCTVPAATNITANVPLDINYTCTAVAGASLPSGVAFRADNITSTDSAIDFIPDATNQGPLSSSVLISPPLVFQVLVDDPIAPGVTEISNLAEIRDDFRLPGTASVTDPVVPNNVTLSGNVFNDNDGLLDGNLVDGSPTNAGGLFASLVDTASGDVIASVAVNGSGMYSFSDVPPNTTYTVQLNTVAQTLNSTPDPADLPVGWLNTGENVGAAAGSDGSPDGVLSVTVATADIDNINFGIERPPVASDVTASIQANPGGTVQVMVPPLVVSDPEDGTPTTITIETLPDAGTQGTLFYSGSPVVAGVPIVNFDPNLLTVDPVDGDVTVSFVYSTTDAAGVKSNNATVTMPFGGFLISGNVSADTTGNDAGDAPLAGVVVQLYSDPNGDGNPGDGAVVATTTTDAAGNYLFTGLATGDYVVVETDPIGFISVSDSQSADGDVAGNANTNDNQIAVSLAPGENDINNDFVDRQRSSLAGTVWLDEDLDGINDIGEAGLSGIVVDLYDGPTLIATTVTDANGDYFFADIPPGNFTVDVDDNTLPANLTNTAGQFGVDPRPVSVTAGDRVDMVDFGYIPDTGTGAIGDRVWSDADNDGIQDEGEAGIAGVVLELQDGVCTPGSNCPTTTTNADGDYLFTNVPFGDDYIIVIDPADPALTGNAYVPSSGPQSEGGYVGHPVSLDASLTTVSDIDFGFTAPNLNTIVDTLWFDSDGDGVFDADESPISNVTVNLVDDASGEVIATATSNSDGVVTFSGLPDDTYRLEITDFNAALPGLDGTTSEAIAGSSDPVTVSGGATDTQTSFGYNNPGLIAGVIYSDADSSVDREPGEPGLAGITVTLTPPAGIDLGNGPGVAITTTTGPDGSYAFDGLPAGDYQVAVSPPAGTQLEDPEGAVDNTASISLPLGGSSVGNDFGYANANLNDISGTVFLDTDKDGVEEAGEPGFADVTIVLLDSAGNVVASTVSDSSGNYSFPGLPDGDYAVAVTDTTRLLAGYDITSGLDTIAVSVAGAPVADIDFGYVKDEATGSITGEVFIDESNFNGLADDPETNLGGVVVFLCAAADAPCTAGNAIATTTTDARGEYGFFGLDAGQYAIDVDPATAPAALQLSVDPAPIALSEGEEVTDVDVGYIPDANTGVLAGFVWTDVNSDGVYQSGEAPIPGVDIFVYSTSGTSLTLLATGTTGPDGQWVVTGISGADLQDGLLVTYDDADIPITLEPIQPTNLPLGDDNYFPVNLASDDDNNISYLDFAFPPQVGSDFGSIAGTIYSDADEDGSYAAATDGELAGVSINLFNSSGELIATTSTDANGNYSFTGLVDDATGYQVVITDLDNVLGDLNPNETIGNPVPIVGGADITDQNAGFISDPDLGSLGNRFWLDSNGDGIIQDDEPGIEGITLQIWLDNGPTLQTPNDPTMTYAAPIPGEDNLVRTVKTDENGEFYFTSLPAGQYIVVVSDSLGYTEMDDGTTVPGGAGDGLAKPWIYVLTKSATGPNYTADFGVAGANSLSGTVFIEDIDLVDASDPFDAGGGVPGVEDGGKLDGLADGVNDVGASNVLVVLLVEQPDGSYVEVQSTLTDANGDYAFAGLPDGNYRVQVRPSGSVIDGFGQTADPDVAGVYPANVCDSPTAADCDDATNVSLSGGATSGLDFGYQKKFVTTPVTLNWFTATSIGNGVEFNWETSNEVGHIGYQIFARTDDGWQLLNEELIVSTDSGDALQLRNYSFTSYLVEARWFALVDVSAAEELTIHGPFKLDQAYGAELTEPEEFDWTGIALPGADKSALEQSVQGRLQRALLLDDPYLDAQEDLLEDQAGEASAQTGEEQ